MHELISLWMSWVQDWGYAGVIVLMAMESSIFPVPSEVVIPPAAILSAQEGASMSFWGVVAAGTFGSWLGSAITYAVARIVKHGQKVRVVVVDTNEISRTIDFMFAQDYEE